MGHCATSADKEHRRVFHPGGEFRYDPVFLVIVIPVVALRLGQGRKFRYMRIPFVLHTARACDKTCFNGVARVCSFGRVFIGVVDTVLFVRSVEIDLTVPTQHSMTAR